MTWNRHDGQLRAPARNRRKSLLIERRPAVSASRAADWAQARPHVLPQTHVFLRQRRDARRIVRYKKTLIQVVLARSERVNASCCWDATSICAAPTASATSSGSVFT